jgi:hypothetical protein
MITGGAVHYLFLRYSRSIYLKYESSCRGSWSHVGLEPVRSTAFCQIKLLWALCHYEFLFLLVWFTYIPVELQIISYVLYVINTFI